MMYQSLRDSLAVLDVELVPLYERLVSIRRKLAALATKSKRPREELKKLKEELRIIDSLRVPFILAEFRNPDS